ncbi:radical SAM protein [Thermofilum pendens]|uniref:Radical SAM domain protein n=1 Tax=Thermofilum pendens (strain DSM 2475 / Hrk 5) TaxID=368408 RepID=A1RXE3_THEPD|nr:radical SAM protein [Thermofilum pendens]ABL77873.1 Radical SAM domain protein [Thermofilum pendens Hrk 5]
MKRVRTLKSGSVVYGKLPRGCTLCQQGLKTVIFLTGLCPYNCFYCPLSNYRKQRDVTFVNEVEVYDPGEYFTLLKAEILRSGSLGASLTGGDPLVKQSLSVETAKFLKEVFGKGFHIHVYTTGLLLRHETLNSLVEAGLDELRIHAPLDRLEEVLNVASEWGDKLSIGLEYPALPRSEDSLVRLLEVAERYELDFVNLNQLEFTETNSVSLELRGYRLSEDYRSAEGSAEAALKAVSYAEEKRLNISVHYCPVKVKDHYQTGLRLYRLAVLSAATHQYVTDDGTLVEVSYDELASGNEHVASLYADKFIHPMLVDKVKKGKVLERNPALRKLVLEETPIREEREHGENAFRKN